MTMNELVKLTTLLTTGPRKKKYLYYQHVIELRGIYTSNHTVSYIKYIKFKSSNWSVKKAILISMKLISIYLLND